MTFAADVAGPATGVGKHRPGELDPATDRGQRSPTAAGFGQHQPAALSATELGATKPGLNSAAGAPQKQSVERHQHVAGHSDVQCEPAHGLLSDNDSKHNARSATLTYGTCGIFQRTRVGRSFGAVQVGLVL